MKLIAYGLAAVLISFHPAHAQGPGEKHDEITESEHCAPGDPMCVEKAPASPKLPPVAKAPAKPKKPAEDPAKARERRNAEAEAALRKNAPTLRAAGDEKGVTSAGDVRRNYTEKASANGNQDIRFDDDGLSASGATGCTIKVRPAVTIELPCFDKFWSVFKDGQQIESALQREYAEMQRCMDACVSEPDAAFLSACIDWKGFRAVRSEDSDVSYFDSIGTGGDRLPALACEASRIQAGLASGQYLGTHTQNPDFDESKGQKRVCTSQSAEVAKEVKKVGEKLAKKFASTHECPKSKADFEGLKSYAEALLVMGGKVESLPALKAGGKMPRGCGYSQKHDSFFSRAVYCTDGNTCYDQMRDSYKTDCTKFTRRDSRDRYLYAQGKDCVGMSSYHDDPHGAESRGDLLLMPIAPGVWIQAYRNGMGLQGFNYVGLVFAD